MSRSDENGLPPEHVECQPCNNFVESESSLLPYGGYSTHGCPECGGEGVRRFCDNCHRDHHKNGWCTCYKTQNTKLREQLRIALMELERLASGNWGISPSGQSTNYIEWAIEIAKMAIDKIKAMEKVG